MAISFNKKEVEKKKEQKRKEKEKRRAEKKATGSGSLDDMIAYVDENGVITDTPPDPVMKHKVSAESIAISTPRREDREDEEDAVMNGRVEFFNRDRGFGFIKNTSGTEKYFFHASNAPYNIAEGQRVTFEIERGKKGMDAVRIVIAE
jgi:cold shock CspA family protein